MFTTVDKAIAAIIGGFLSVLALVFNTDIGLSPEVVASISSVITAILVYLVPNKEPAPVEPTDPEV